MSVADEYEPSTRQWVRDQVEEYERSGGAAANTLRDTGMPIIVVTNRGARSGKLRKTPLMRVEHDGAYALVASMGGAPKNPVWYYNLRAHPDDVTIQDGPEPFPVAVREVDGDERALWWEPAPGSASRPRARRRDRSSAATGGGTRARTDVAAPHRPPTPQPMLPERPGRRRRWRVPPRRAPPSVPRRRERPSRRQPGRPEQPG